MASTPSTADDEEKCWQCGTTKPQQAKSSTALLQRCSRCRVARYCCREHQLQHWPTHKSLCNTLVKAKTSSPATSKPTTPTPTPTPTPDTPTQTSSNQQHITCTGNTNDDTNQKNINNKHDDEHDDDEDDDTQEIDKSMIDDEHDAPLPVPLALSTANMSESPLSPCGIHLRSDTSQYVHALNV
jgi:hypothetical protein